MCIVGMPLFFHRMATSEEIDLNPNRQHDTLNLFGRKNEFEEILFDSATSARLLVNYFSGKNKVNLSTIGTNELISSVFGVSANTYLQLTKQEKTIRFGYRNLNDIKLQNMVTVEGWILTESEKNLLDLIDRKNSRIRLKRQFVS